MYSYRFLLISNDKERSVIQELNIVNLGDRQPEYVKDRGVRKVEGLQDGLQPGLVKFSLF